MSEKGEVRPECLCRSGECAHVRIYKVEGIFQKRVFGGKKGERRSNSELKTLLGEQCLAKSMKKFDIYPEWKRLHTSNAFENAKRRLKK